MFTPVKEIKEREIVQKKIIFLLSFILDIFGVLLTPFVALIASIQARLSATRLPLTYKIWDLFSATPIRYHYYEPIFNVFKLPEKIWEHPDPLHGIDLNVEAQLNLLNKFDYSSELNDIPVEKTEKDLDYFYNNYNFGAGDAEILYSVIRHFKPKKIVEIGSGFSTRLAKKALDENRKTGFDSEHICIEPYEMPWLNQLETTKVIRSLVEDTDISIFKDLEENDILFIDSSHVIRTGGDVVFEYLRILPILKKGVIVHIHDIFLPYEYPKHWIQLYRRFWTEQYLFQAFLTYNTNFKVLLSLNYLEKNHPNAFSQACPVYANKHRKLPVSSFWIQRTV